MLCTHASSFRICTCMDMYITYAYMLYTALYHVYYYIPTLYSNMRVSKSHLHNNTSELRSFCHFYVTINSSQECHCSLLRVPRLHMGQDHLFQDSSPWASDGGSNKLWLCQAALKDCPSLSCRLLINFSASVTNEIRSCGWSGCLNYTVLTLTLKTLHHLLPFSWFSWPGHHLHYCLTSRCHLPRASLLCMPVGQLLLLLFGFH